jgi:hypothetical protein
MLRAKKHPSGELVKTWSVCRAKEKKNFCTLSENEHLTVGACSAFMGRLWRLLSQQNAAILPSRPHLAAAEELAAKKQYEHVSPIE